MSGRVLSAEDFPHLRPDPAWGSDEEIERRRRIALSVACYAYEIADRPFLDDLTFDAAANRIRPQLTTGHPLLDEFFLTEFSPMTGLWIHRHPELDKVRACYEHYVRVCDPPVWKERFRGIQNNSARA